MTSVSGPGKADKSNGSEERWRRGWTNYTLDDIEDLALNPSVMLDGTATWERLAVMMTDWRNPEGGWEMPSSWIESHMGR